MYILSTVNAMKRCKSCGEEFETLGPGRRVRCGSCVEDQRCTVKGCLQPTGKCSLCPMHANRKYRGAGVNKIRCRRCRAVCVVVQATSRYFLCTTCTSFMENRTCAVEFCEKKVDIHRSSKLCSTHYRRRGRVGDPGFVTCRCCRELFYQPRILKGAYTCSACVSGACSIRNGCRRREAIGEEREGQKAGHVQP